MKILKISLNKEFSAAIFNLVHLIGLCHLKYLDGCSREGKYLRAALFFLNEDFSYWIFLLKVLTRQHPTHLEYILYNGHPRGSVMGEWMSIRSIGGCPLGTLPSIVNFIWNPTLYSILRTIYSWIRSFHSLFWQQNRNFLA